MLCIFKGLLSYKFRVGTKKPNLYAHDYQGLSGIS